jgi:hypothetical protein
MRARGSPEGGNRTPFRDQESVGRDRQPGVAAFAPGDVMPLLFRQRQCELLDRHRLMVRIASHQLRRGRPFPLQRFGRFGAVPGAQRPVDGSDGPRDRRS